MKSAFWVATVALILIFTLLAGSHSGQQGVAASLSGIDENATLTATNTATQVVSSTATTVVTPTITYTPTPTVILTATPTTTPTPAVTLTATPTTTPTPPGTITPTPTPTVIEVIVEDPDIDPPYNSLCDSYWYIFANDRGHNSYLTLNVQDYVYSSNSAIWRPDLPEPGYYQIDAYIPYHPAILWDCGSNPRTIPYDTSDAHYIISHASGFTEITGTQSSYSDNWLPLGEYYFHSGTSGAVSLTDLNSEENFTTTVSFSAIRFTWMRPPPTTIFLPVVSGLDPPVITGTVGIMNAPAFDQCNLPNTNRMQTWWNKSPYRITNVYIGGISLAADCTVPNRAWIDTVHNQGWGMIPTWVGLQAPCSSLKHRMSWNPAIAYEQGQAEAVAASQVAASIGLSGPGIGSTIIYYDMEAFGTSNGECREVVKSFLAGWTERLHSLGNQPAIYGAGCSSNVTDWAALALPPQNVWIADIITPYKYRENVPLFGLRCVSDTLWPNHQRTRQYAFAHNETYGGVTFNIDSDIADAEVVLPPQNLASLLPTTLISSGSPEITSFGSSQTSPDRGWLSLANTLYRRSTTTSELWNPLPLPATVKAVDQSFFLNENLGWMIAVDNDASFKLYTTVDGGNSWQKPSSLPIVMGWIPESIQFTDAQHGWIAVKLQTNSAFSIGQLLLTSDGGTTWKTRELPVGGEVAFSTARFGWLAGGISGKDLYQSKDGGDTWEQATISLPAYDYVSVGLPVFRDPQNGTLPVILQIEDQTRLLIYVTQDQGNTWTLEDVNQQLPAGFSQVKFVTSLDGWGITWVGNCSENQNARNCTSQTGLWQTSDGGATWVPVKFP